MPVTIEEHILGDLKKIKFSWDATGVTAPGAVTAALAGDGAGNVDNGAHLYKVTFVTADGETEAGTASETVTVADKTTDGKVSLTGIPLGPSGTTARKIYRTEAGLSTYKLLATLSDNTTEIYTDNTADSSLGATAPSTNTTGNISATTTKSFSGVLLRAVTVPSGGNPPEANYDVTVTDADGFDVLGGGGANRHTSNTEAITSGLLPIAHSTLTLNVTHSGAAGAGDVYLYLR